MHIIASDHENKKRPAKGRTHIENTVRYRLLPPAPAVGAELAGRQCDGVGQIFELEELERGKLHFLAHAVHHALVLLARIVGVLIRQLIVAAALDFLDNPPRNQLHGEKWSVKS